MRARALFPFFLLDVPNNASVRTRVRALFTGKICTRIGRLIEIFALA